MPHKAKPEPDPNVAWLKSLHPALRMLAEWEQWPLARGGKVLIACSGGRDSVALAHAAWALLATEPHRTHLSEHLRHRFNAAGKFDLPHVSLWHFDHGLREGSTQDADIVRRLAASMGLPFILAEGFLLEHPSFGKQNTMALAREERYGALSQQVFAEAQSNAFVTESGHVTNLRSGCCAWLAHHAQDQAETLLLNLVRGTGLPGLAGMASWAPALATFRPWLNLTPEWIADYAQSAGLVWQEDPTNANTDYARSLVRHKVLPLLLDLNAAAVRHLGEAAMYAGEAVGLLREIGRTLQTFDLAPFIYGKLPLSIEPPPAFGVVSLPDVPPFSLEMWLAVEPVVQCWLLDASNATADVFRRWLAHPVSKLSLGGGTFSYRDGWLDFTRTLPPPEVIDDSLLGPLGHKEAAVGLCRASLRKSRMEGARVAKLAEKERHIVWDRLMEAAYEESRWLPEPVGVIGSSYKCFLPASVVLPLHFRTRRVGDRIALAGQAGGRRLVSDVFIDHKIPVHLRDIWLLLVDAEDNVLWIPGLADSDVMREALTTGSTYTVSLARHYSDLAFPWSQNMTRDVEL